VCIAVGQVVTTVLPSAEKCNVLHDTKRDPSWQFWNLDALSNLYT
jgi:hypothetical protein